ncbi:MAG: MFS transporter [Paracoccaceae bacterium]|nr:MFS transporter [Paracoccaceae bacterium]
MRPGLAVLLLGYVLSQFYRAFLAVLAPDLGADLGATAEELSRASGAWFLAFAAMQIPVGWALDRIGPRRTAALLLALGGGGGAALFAAATTPAQVTAAMALIGIGCSPVYMASLYIFARSFSPAVFATLAAGLIGLGSLGNLAGSAPLALAAETLGWRATVAVLAALTALTAAAILAFVKDPPKAEGDGTGSLLDLLKMPALWPILLMMAAHYAPPMGIRGLWIGPYFAEVFHASAAEVGRASLFMALAMIAGNFAYGPLDRLLGTRKWVVLPGNLLAALCLLALWATPAASPWLATLLLAGVGFFGASYGVVIAHGRALFPAHLAGRGVTLLNLFGIGGVGLLQLASGRLHAAVPGPPAQAYAAVFLLFALLLILACLVYLTSQDRTD